MTAKIIETEAEIKQKSKDLVKYTEYTESEDGLVSVIDPGAIAQSATKSFFKSVKGKDLYVQFAGQCVAMYANDLKILIGNSHARPLLEKACASLKALAQDENFASELPQGLDFLHWSVSTWPDLDYLNSAPVAYPLITLTQLAQYVVTMQELGVTKAEDIDFAGGFGHSSGVISAAIVALASSVEEFEKLAVEAVMLQAVHGLRCTQHFPSIKLPISIWREHYVRWKPTPMLHVKHGGLPRNKAYLSEVIETHNKHAETKQRHLVVGLMNGTASVVCGAAESLHWLYEHLTKDAGLDQGRVPFSSRKIILKVQFLDTGVPFHSFHLKDAAKDILADVAKRADLSSIRELADQNASFKFPVYNTCDGERMDKFDLAKLITLQTTEALDWVKTTNVLAAKPGYVLDFGPQTAIATMTQFLHEGNGAVVLPASNLFKTLSKGLPDCTSWESRFSPGLNKEGEVETKFTKLVSRPPVMVPGMTPWSHVEQVAEVAKAGYHAELAGGGIPLPHLFEAAIRELSLSIPVGSGININLLYLNAYLWGFQFPLIEKLCAKGEPIESFTVAAGIPSLEKLRDMVASAKRANLKFIAFKPGTVDMILNVLEICSQFPDFQFVIQWTGGRSGGHHSFEDQFQALLETYAQIRANENVTLVVGGGIGDAEGAYDWLSGKWSEQFGFPRMPVDAILMGSRMLATKESKTGGATKDLMLKAEGVDNSVWEQSMKQGGNAGGVITVKSELGEPIHVVKNRCSELWRHFDEKYFGLSIDDMVIALQRDKKMVVEGLNKDFQKPWFGQKDGKACDLGEMTYYGVCVRLTELMYSNPGDKWIDISYQVRLEEMLVRTEERFASNETLTLVDKNALATKPYDVIDKVFAKYPQGRFSQLLIEDQDFFVGSVCGRFDRKPVNFISRIDQMFKRNFKGDSLWFSECLNAVVENDAERTFIIYGPVAAQHVNSKEETIKDVLDEINNGVKQLIKQKQSSAAPLVQDVGSWLQTFIASQGIKINMSKVPSGEQLLQFTLGEQVFDVENLCMLLTQIDVGTSIETGYVSPGPQSGWMKALFHPLVVRGDKHAPSPIHGVLQPVPGMNIALASSGNHIRIQKEGKPLVDIMFDPVKSVISIKLLRCIPAPNDGPLEYEYYFMPSTPGFPLHERAAMRYRTATFFYAQAWEDSTRRGSLSGIVPKPLSNSNSKSFSSVCNLAELAEAAELDGEFAKSNQITLTREQLVSFCRTVGFDFECYIQAPNPRIPMDFGIVVGWEAIIGAVLSDERVGHVNWLELLHLENSFTEIEPRYMKSQVDKFETEFEVMEVSTTPSGKKISVHGVISHHNKPWVRMNTSFFVPTDIASCVEKNEERVKPFKITSKSFLLKVDETMKAMILSKEFFSLMENVEGLTTPCNVLVDIVSVDTKVSETSWNISLKGNLVKHDNWRSTEIGTVFYEQSAVNGNPVLAFLERHAVEYPPYFALPSPYLALVTPDVTRAPMNMKRYSQVSGDWNPIHTEDHFARFAGQSGPIVHGMWLSANARRVLTEHLGGQDKQQVTKWKTEFTDTVPLGASLVTQVKHMGMQDGQCVYEIETRKQADGRVCLKATASMRTPKTMLTFTGQGAQSVGMGKELRESSKVAGELWARAEDHFVRKYGLSILQIIDENPKEVTVHFGGPDGSRIRESYRKLKRTTPEGEVLPIFPNIDETSWSHTFFAPGGLLNSTEFTQPAIVITELAQVLDLKENQFLPDEAMFAGHSLGEYAALAAVGGLFEVENLIDIVFMRGLTMQKFVPRNAQGVSDYGMVAVNPGRVNKKFGIKDLEEVVDAINSKEELLQIVNYNVDPVQYVCAGHVRALMALRLVLDEIQGTGCSNVAAIGKHAASAKFQSLDMLKGKATIPLKGIDVPFHSRMLLPGVDAFRKVIDGMVPKPLRTAKHFVDRYIPNVTGIPLECSREYLQFAVKKTGSKVLQEILASWTEGGKSALSSREIIRTLIIELLAFQFASPVLWTKTVEEALCKSHVKRVIEFGPGPTLKGMLTNATKLTPAVQQVGDIANHHFSDSTAVKFGMDDKGLSAKEWIAQQQPADVEDDEDEAEETPMPAPVAPAAAPVPAPAAAVPQAASGPSVDMPVQAVDVLKAIISMRAGIKEVSGDKTLSQLVEGKSALKNEIVGELSAEFGTDPPDGGDDLKLEKLAGHWANYNKLGKITTQMINKALVQTMPAGTNLNSLRKQFEDEFNVTNNTAGAIALRTIACAPAKRLNAGEAKSWRQTLVDKFNSDMGGAGVGPRGGGAGGGAAAGGAAVATAAIDPQMASKLKKFASTISKAATDFLGADEKPVVPEEIPLSPLEMEFGEKFAEGVKPLFTAEQVREYNDWWAIGQRRLRQAWDDSEKAKLELDSEAWKISQHFASITTTQDLMPLISWFSSRATGNGKAFMEQVGKEVKKPPVFCEVGGTTKPTVCVDKKGQIKYEEVPRNATMLDYVDELSSKGFVEMRSRGDKSTSGDEPTDAQTTKVYFDALRDIAKNGICLKGKVALITGLSPGSIAEPVAKVLLQAGATVIATMRPKSGGKSYTFFRDLYSDYCGAGARLIAVPFNQASRQDVFNLVKFIYAKQGQGGGLELDLDFVFPFAAAPENGRGIEKVDDISELAHRVMLTHTVLLVGKISEAKKQQKIVRKQALVFTPLSPNHGVFGYDGLYAESKLGLEAFFHKWKSEHLQDYLSIVGVTIGWVRGTNLMASQNTVALSVENSGARTFTTAEMAFNMAGLMHPDMVRIVQQQTMEAMLSGGMEKVVNISGVTEEARATLNRESAKVKAVWADLQADEMVQSAGDVRKAQEEKEKKTIRPRPYGSYAVHTAKSIPSAERRSALKHLQGMVDPSSTVVVTGFGEVGPWGHSWTRWQMERDGEFSLEGCVMMSWMLGFIKYFNGPRPQPAGPPVHYSGWVDAATSNPVSPWDVKKNYEERILSRCGMRLLDPEVMEGFDGTNKMQHHTVLLEEDLPPVEVEDMDTAREFKRIHGDPVEIMEDASGTIKVQVKAGAKIYVPRALHTDRWVCAQVPTGWDPKRFDIPDDIVRQVDRVTLYTLVAAAQSLRESGVMDPYEFYEYIHLSQLGNAIGSGIGGVSHLRDMFVNRYHSDAKAVKGDLLQETFINTTAAWVNMLLIGSCGPIKTPVAACATAMASASIAVDTILSGQAKVMLVGATDDLSQESIAEFASMKATASADADKAKGRMPSEISRPMSQTRSGFCESHGAGVMVFMSGDLALQMGVPIRAIVGNVYMSTDGLGRSVPAPGQGVLGHASECRESPLLSLDVRRELLSKELDNLKTLRTHSSLPDDEITRLEGLARRRYSIDWWQSDPTQSPLRGALSTYGLTANDITFASCHGTSTKLNDKNECSVLQQEMDTLGRSSGNPLFIVAQKWLTGHPKGPAAAWQMNGAIQAMSESVIPGNRNLDCVDPNLRNFPNLFFPRASMHDQYVSAALVNSFGFGQAGGQCLFINPDYFLSSLDDASFSCYANKLVAREQRIFQHRQNIYGGRTPWTPIKSSENTPHKDSFSKVCLNKGVRRESTFAPVNDINLKFAPTSRTPESAQVDSPALTQALTSTMQESGGAGKAMGIDAEPVREFAESFMVRNFTKAEREDILKQDKASGTTRTATGFWAAKEAVVKALGNAGLTLGAASDPLIDIELCRKENGSLGVQLHGKVIAATKSLKITNVRVSLSYADNTAYAAAIIV